MMRFAFGFVLLIVAMFAMSLAPFVDTLQAADTPQVTALKNQIQQLQASLTTSQTQVTNLQAQVNQLTVANTKLKAKGTVAVPVGVAVPVVPVDVLKMKATLDAMTNAPFVHSVVLRLKADTPSTEVQALLNDLPSLGTIASVRGLWFGKPADPATPDLAVKDYTVGVTLLFDDYNGLTTYLNDPIHKKFVDQHLKLWEKPVVYDVLRPVPATP